MGKGVEGLLILQRVIGFFFPLQNNPFVVGIPTGQSGINPHGESNVLLRY